MTEHITVHNDVDVSYDIVVGHLLARQDTRVFTVHSYTYTYRRSVIRQSRSHANSVA